MKFFASVLSVCCAFFLLGPAVQAEGWDSDKVEVQYILGEFQYESLAGLDMFSQVIKSDDETAESLICLLDGETKISIDGQNTSLEDLGQLSGKGMLLRAELLRKTKEGYRFIIAGKLELQTADENTKIPSPAEEGKLVLKMKEMDSAAIKMIFYYEVLVYLDKELDAVDQRLQEYGP